MEQEEQDDQKEETTRKLIDLKKISLKILDRYAEKKGTKSKPMIEEFLEDLCLQIKRKHPNILTKKREVKDKFKAKLA